jgi:hypothetical protein
MALALSDELPDRGAPWLGIGLFFGSAFLGGRILLALTRGIRRLYAERRRLKAATAAEAREADRRPPILLLRAFADDGREVHLVEEGAVPVTLEEVLVARLSRRGPVVAVGRPGDRLPPIGAGREYVAGDWQARVRQLIGEAAVVVVLIHETPGLLWEVEQIFTGACEGRLVLVVPAAEPEVLDRRWAAVRRTIEALDPGMRDGRLSLPMDGALALVFDAGGRPLRIVGRKRIRGYYVDAVEQALWFVGVAGRRKGRDTGGKKGVWDNRPGAARSSSSSWSG